MISRFFFFNDTATTEIYTLSLHDALPISEAQSGHRTEPRSPRTQNTTHPGYPWLDSDSQTTRSPSCPPSRSEEHTSELQSLRHLVCRLLLETKNNWAVMSAGPVCSDTRSA